MQVEILHKIDSDFMPNADGDYQLVGILEIQMPKDASPTELLEQAWYYTNHIRAEGWTFHNCVVRTWPPCRSSSVGDIFVINGHRFLIDIFGFKFLRGYVNDN